jgi:hypothetical protein
VDDITAWDAEDGGAEDGGAEDGGRKCGIARETGKTKKFCTIKNKYLPLEIIFHRRFFACSDTLKIYNNKILVNFKH